MPAADAVPVSMAGAPPQTLSGEAAFEALFRAHYDAVYRLLYRVCGTREEAEDLAQEAFLRLHRSPRLWAAGQKVRSWVYRVAVNLAYNAARSQGRRARREQQVYARLPDFERSAPDPADAAIRADERARVRATLATLPERQAALLLLRHAGLSYRELADALEVAPGSIGTLLARAEDAFVRAYREGVGEMGGEDGV